MVWNWQLPDWPKFKYDVSKILPLEKRFLQAVGGGVAVLKHLEDEQKKKFIIEILCAEGLNNAEIEGEILKRESLQSSIRKHFGLKVKTKIYPKEMGMGELIWDVYTSFQEELSHEMLFKWHKFLMSHESKVSDVGKYRTHDDPMQIISNRYDKRVVYFEAPPSNRVYKEMSRFVKWFNTPTQKELVLAKASVCHIYFESIHPFEDGNGRVGRALVEKILSQSLGSSALIAVSQVIMKKRKDYYQALAKCNRTLNIQSWIEFFSNIILQAQEESLVFINFLMAKSKLMSRLKGQINYRQEKVLLRFFSEGITGFQGGLSAENYIAITKSSKATATRDLTDLVEKKALYKTGKLRHTRYWLNIDD